MPARARQAISHWKEFQPERYKRLKETGKLQQEAEAAERLTQKALRELMDQGATYHEAWEQVRELYLFPPPEPGLYDQDEGPENLAFEALKEMNEILEQAED